MMALMSLPEAFHDHPAYLAVWFITYAICIVPEIVLSKRLRRGTMLRSSIRLLFEAGTVVPELPYALEDGTEAAISFA